MRTRELDYASIQFRDDNILHIDYADKYFFKLRESKEILRACRELIPDIQYSPILITKGLATETDSEFRKHCSGEEVLQYCSAMALVVNSLAQVVIVNFFIKFNKPVKPTRFFKDKESALDWLRTFETKKMSVEILETRKENV